MSALLRTGSILALVLLLAPGFARATDLAHGAYLTRAADCAGCHTVPNGVEFAGGRPFKLPFGVLYSPNITPDPASGIAGYSDDDWVRMLQQGVGRGGRHLYPAMPYPSYTAMSRNDALAIKDYLMSLPPVPGMPPQNRLRFPFNQRWGMAFWNVLNNPDRRFTPDDRKSAAYNRGDYLVNALGHCGECHTPRTQTMALNNRRRLAGALQDGWLSYNITGDTVHGVGGWSDAALKTYLSTGTAPGHGPASGPMSEAVGFSLRYLTSDDIADMVTYLRNVTPQPDGPAAVVAGAAGAGAADDGLGARLFVQACAGCHLPSGAGRQSAWAALAGAQSTGDPAGTNLVQVLTHGTQLPTPEGLMFMHPFTRAYTDPELAALANDVVGQFGHRDGTVTAAQIGKARGR